MPRRPITVPIRKKAVGEIQLLIDDWPVSFGAAVTSQHGDDSVISISRRVEWVRSIIFRVPSGRCVPGFSSWFFSGSGGFFL